MLRHRCAFVALIAFASPSGAIISDPMPRVCNEFPHSDYVFSGKVLSTAFRENIRVGVDRDASNQYRIRVDHVFKGHVPHRALIYTPADSGGGNLTVGQLAIIFATRTDSHIVFSGSSNSTSGIDTPRVVSEIKAFMIHPPKVATISGRVDASGPDAPLAGVRLLLSNGKARKFVRAGSHGRFTESVTPGHWSVRIAEPGWASRSGTYSYDFAEGTDLGRGGCADLELEVAAPGVKLEGPDWKRWPK